MTLSGRVFETIANGARPFSDGYVDFTVDEPIDSGLRRGGQTAIGTDGSYSIAGVPDGTLVKVRAYPATTNGPVTQCVTTGSMKGPSRLDIELFRPGVPRPSPTLSGQVFAMTGESQEPLANVEIYYRSSGLGPDVFMATDSAGRYSFCRIPPVTGALYGVCGNDVVAFSLPVDIRADATLDVDATKWRDCFVPRP